MIRTPFKLLSLLAATAFLSAAATAQATDVTWPGAPFATLQHLTGEPRESNHPIEMRNIFCPLRFWRMAQKSKFVD